MEKFILIMWLCTATTAIDCKQIKTDRIKFNDQYSCTMYGYTHSAKLIRDFGREQINQNNFYTKFWCMPKQNLDKKKIDA